ncbi:gp 4.5, partial [Enterobacteria phage T7M]
RLVEFGAGMQEIIEK